MSRILHTILVLTNDKRRHLRAEPEYVSTESMERKGDLTFPREFYLGNGVIYDYSDPNFNEK